MSEIKQSPVLEFVVDLLKNAIADAKVEKQSPNIATVKDGNDIIHIEQLSGSSDSIAAISITDKKEIILSEDLLEPLMNIHKGKGISKDLTGALQTANITINGLSIETKLIFQAVKDCFDQLSNSYEFVKVIEKESNELTIQLKFGNHTFNLIIVNQADSIDIKPDFVKDLDAAVKKAIEDDSAKVQNAVNKLFKEV